MSKTTTPANTLLGTLKGFISKICSIDLETIRDDAKLVGDHAMTSTMLFKLTVDIEKECGLEVPSFLGLDVLVSSRTDLTFVQLHGLVCSWIKAYKK